MRFPLPPTGPIYLPTVLIGPKSHQEADFLLDTGAEYCSIRTSMARLLGYDLKRQHRMITIATANGTLRVPSILVGEIRIGNAYAQHVAVTCQDIPGIAGFIGLNFLRRCRMVIDYGKHRLDIVRFGGQADAQRHPFR